MTLCIRNIWWGQRGVYIVYDASKNLLDVLTIIIVISIRLAGIIAAHDFAKNCKQNEEMVVESVKCSRGWITIKYTNKKENGAIQLKSLCRKQSKMDAQKG